MRSILPLVVVALLALVSCEAFSPLPNSVVSATTQSSTAVYFFGGNKKNNDKKKPKGKVEEKKKKAPMIMMFGKPQYDWVKNREVKPGENTRRMNWLVKPGEKK